ncbi:duf1680 domain-containing protein [Xylariaceae sp. FL0804]|nr:duf1680 domain-containing protein [Xylariaceae sp. FL0804]
MRRILPTSYQVSCYLSVPRSSAQMAAIKGKAVTKTPITVVLAVLSPVVVLLILIPILATQAFASGLRTIQPRNNSSLIQPVYQALPLGSIKPLGWLKDQLETEADGLAGNLFDFYRFVQDSMWLGGNSEYSTLHESAPYWFNGLVPLAFGLDDVRLKGQVQDFLDYILSHQQSDGWIGPETTPQTRSLWARCYILLGLMQYAEADPSQTDRIVDSMHRYIELAHSMLQDNFTGLIEHPGDVFDSDGFGAARAHEMHIPLQWLYENYPRNNSELIWDTMELMIDGATEFGVDWRNYWVEGVYPEVIYDPMTTSSFSWLFNHGVNMAEGLRFPLAIYRMTHDEALKTQTRTAVDLVARWHKSLAGTIIGDEYITDLNPIRGAELCTSTETIFSLSWIYQYLGDNDLADWAELAAFNAYPGQLSPDWWSHQYVQQENQPWARNLSQAPDMWTNVGTYGNVFGLEPNYPCCTVNYPQGYPKFLANSFVRTQDGGIAHVLLSPGSVSTTLDGGSNRISISTNTTYPFGLDLTYTITADAPFAFYVRVPEWASDDSTWSLLSSSSSTSPSSSSNSSSSSSATTTTISPTSGRLQRFALPAGGAWTATLSLHAPAARVVPRANGTAAVYHGALLYSLALDSESAAVAGPPEAYDGSGPVPANSTTALARDHVVRATSDWAIAIDPSQITVVRRSSSNSNSSNSGGEKKEDVEELANPIFAPGAPPLELRVAAARVSNWGVAFDTAADPPLAPALEGAPFVARLVPFGSAKVHMAHLPVVRIEQQLDLVGAEAYP